MKTAEKPIGGKNYGSIPHLSNSKLGEKDYYIGPGQERILTEKCRDRHDRILVFEKYDGSNVGVARYGGQIHALTRAGYGARTSPFRQHHLFADWVGTRAGLFASLLREGERIVGEWMAQAHGLRYRIEGDPIVFFDCFTPDNRRVLQEELFERAMAHGLRLPRKLHEGGPVGVGDVLPLLNSGTPGLLALDMPEGMVFRVERKGKVDFLAKWVRQDFPTGQYCIDVEEKDLVWNVPLGLDYGKPPFS